VTSERAADPTYDLIVIGDCNPDVLVVGGDVTPAFGQEEKLVDSMSLVVGGSAAITAVAAARLGLRVALLAATGADAAGNFMLAELARAGVDTASMATRTDLPTGMTVALSRGNDRAILTAMGAIGALTPADVPADLLARTRHVHVSSYFLLEASLGPGLAAVLAAARAGGTSTSLDTNWDPAQRWGSDALRAAIAQTDLLVPNEAEALAIAGSDTLPDAVRALGKTGTRLVVKLGARGALCAENEHSYHVALPPVRAVDTTGAGDCFNAGLIAGLQRGLDLPHAAALGCAAGAASTGAPGGTAAAPDLAAATLLAGQATIRPAGAGM
jgi:sugar/nucleoside kinase (ribokinase family)